MFLFGPNSRQLIHSVPGSPSDNPYNHDTVVLTQLHLRIPLDTCHFKCVVFDTIPNTVPGNPIALYRLPIVDKLPRTPSFHRLLCGNLQLNALSSRRSNTCNNSYTSALQTIAIFGLKLQRFPAMVGAICFLGLYVSLLMSLLVFYIVVH